MLEVCSSLMHAGRVCVCVSLMHARRVHRQALKAQLSPLARAFSSARAAEAMVVAQEPRTETSENSAAEASGNTVTTEGDVTNSLAKDMTTLERRQLVETLNKQATEERARQLRSSFTQHAAGHERHISARTRATAPLRRPHACGQIASFSQECSGTV